MKKPKMVVTGMDQTIAELVKKSNHKILGIWAADCALRTLPYFEKKYPEDGRPRKAIEALLAWVETGVFHMADVRKSSLDAHAAARAVETDDIARSAARACGQAMATAHVATHSIVAAIYAATAVRDATGSEEAVTAEREWQYQHLQQLNASFS